MPNGGANLYSGQDASKLGLVLKGADLFTALGPTHRHDVVGSSLAVLDRERLLSHYELRWDEDSRDKWRDYTVKARPTGQGGKLFLWGHGQRDINAQRMFDTRIALDPFDVPDTPGTLVW